SLRCLTSIHDTLPIFSDVSSDCDDQQSGCWTVENHRRFGETKRRSCQVERQTDWLSGFEWWRDASHHSKPDSQSVCRSTWQLLRFVSPNLRWFSTVQHPLC